MRPSRVPSRIRSLPLIALLASLAAGFGPVAPALAVGGTIQDGNVRFDRVAYGATPSVNLTGVTSNPGQDQLYEAGWWYRVAGDSLERPFPDPDLEDYSQGFASTATWINLKNRGQFSAIEGASVFDSHLLTGGNPSGLVSFSLLVTNLGSSPLSLELFHYADFDLDGPPNDSASLSERSLELAIDLADAGGVIGQYAALTSSDVPLGQIHFQVGPYSDIRDLLDDTAVTQLGDTGLPFGPGDFTGAVQFSIQLAPGASVQVATILLVGLRAHCSNLRGLFCDGFETGDLSFWGP